MQGKRLEKKETREPNAGSVDSLPTARQKNEKKKKTRCPGREKSWGNNGVNEAKKP